METRKTRFGLVDRRYNRTADDLIAEMHSAGHRDTAIHEECRRRGLKVSFSTVYDRACRLRLAEAAPNSTNA